MITRNYYWNYVIDNGNYRRFHQCPVCEDYYFPVCKSKSEAESNLIPINREQWITAICSDNCWDQLFSSDPLEHFDVDEELVNVEDLEEEEK